MSHLFKALAITHLLASLLISITVSGQQASPAFDYLDVFDLQSVSNPQISPDSERIIYERVQYDVMTDRRFVNLWIIEFSGDRHRPLTSGKKSYGSVRWSPSGDRVAYTSSEEGSSQIFVRWMDTGESASLTNLSNSPSNLSWSPDGSMIAFTRFVGSSSDAYASIPSPPKGAKWEAGAQVVDDVTYRRDGGGYVQDGRTHIFVMSSNGGAPRQVTSGDFNHSGPSWAPDSESLIFTSDRSGNADLDPNNAQIYELAIDTGDLTQLTDKRGPHNAPKISPDGKSIAYTGFEDRVVGYQLANLYLMNRDGTNIRSVSDDFTQSISNINWSSDSESVFFQYDEHGRRHVAVIKKSGQAVSIASGLGSATIGRPYTGGSYSISASGRFAYTAGFSTRPTELGVGHHPTRMANRTITNNNEELVKSFSVGEVEEFWTESSVDDFKIQGWIITPAGFDPEKKYPLILEIHGGPYTAYGPNYSPELQLMASQGYVVVYANPRGSTSYSEDFASYINFNYPSEDHNDLMDVVDHVVELGYINPEELFITGGSGGGVLTAWAVGKTDRFAAAVVAKPVINWYSFVLTADASSFFSKYWFTKKPWEDPDQYLARSPISLVGNVTTPTMLLTGQNDYRTPMSETEQYYAALKLQNVDAVMVRIAGAGHGIVARPSNLIRKVSYITDWFDRYRASE